MIDPSLRTRGLDPGTLKIGSDVSLSFDLPNCQNTGHQNNGDHGGTSESVTIQIPLRTSEIPYFQEYPVIIIHLIATNIMAITVGPTEN